MEPTFTITYGGGDLCALNMLDLFNNNVNDMALFLVACKARKVEIGDPNDVYGTYHSSIEVHGPFHMAGDVSAYLETYFDVMYDETAAKNEHVEDCNLADFPEDAVKEGPRVITEEEVETWLQQLDAAREKKEFVIPSFQW